MIMDVVEIQKLLPHRYPMLLVDRVLSLEPEKKIVAVKNVTANENFFNGHFPGHRVWLGVLVLEALAQSCALLAFRSMGIDAKDYVVYLMSIDGAKFRRPVVPGDQLVLTAEVLRHKTSVWKQRGTATVDGKVVAEAEFVATTMKAGAAS